jgi:hypothetical protein
MECISIVTIVASKEIVHRLQKRHRPISTRVMGAVETHISSWTMEDLDRSTISITRLQPLFSNQVWEMGQKVHSNTSKSQQTEPISPAILTGKAKKVEILITSIEKFRTRLQWDWRLKQGSILHQNSRACFIHQRKIPQDPHMLVHQHKTLKVVKFLEL